MTFEGNIVVIEGFSDMNCAGPQTFGTMQMAGVQCTLFLSFTLSGANSGPAPPTFPPQGWFALAEFHDAACASANFITATAIPQAPACDYYGKAHYCDHSSNSLITGYYASRNASCGGAFTSVSKVPDTCDDSGSKVLCPKQFPRDDRRSRHSVITSTDRR